MSRISPFHTDISAAFLSIPAGSSAQTSHAQRRVVRVCVYACVRVRQRARATRAGGAHRRHTSRPRVRSRWPGSPPASPPPPPPAPYAKPSRPVTRFHVVTTQEHAGCHCAGDRAPRQRRRRAIDRADTAAAGSRRGRACGSPNAGSDTHKLQASRTTDACDVPVFLVGKLSYPSV